MKPPSLDLKPTSLDLLRTVSLQKPFTCHWENWVEVDPRAMCYLPLSGLKERRFVRIPGGSQTNTTHGIPTPKVYNTHMYK